MRRYILSCLLVVLVVSNMSADLFGQARTSESTEWARFNQVFVKVIVPVSADAPKQDGPPVESWVARELTKRGEADFFAVTGWVPVCDGLLTDEIVTNAVWDGVLKGDHHFCPVSGDIPQRESSQLLVSLGGWTPVGGSAEMALPDEPGSRGVTPVRIVTQNGEGRADVEKGFPYVAIVVAPPPRSLSATGEGEEQN